MHYYYPGHTRPINITTIKGEQKRSKGSFHFRCYPPLNLYIFSYLHFFFVFNFQYLEIAKTLPSYGCIKFSNCSVDYPKPNEVASIVIGNKELCLQTFSGERCLETKFKVIRMRCWRVTTNYGVRKQSKV